MCFHFLYRFYNSSFTNHAWRIYRKKISFCCVSVDRSLSFEIWLSICIVYLFLHSYFFLQLEYTLTHSYFFSNWYRTMPNYTFVYLACNPYLSFCDFHSSVNILSDGTYICLSYLLQTNIFYRLSITFSDWHCRII